MTSVISRCHGPSLLGFHLMGNEEGPHATVGFSCYVTKEIIMTAIEELKKLPMVILTHCGGDVPLVICNRDIGYTPTVHPRSPASFLPTEAHIKVFGTCAGSAHYKSDIRDSMLVESLSEHLGPQKWGPPRFKQKDGSGEWMPWATALAKFAQPCTTVDPVLLHRATSDYLSDLVPLLDLHVNRGHVQPLTDNQILCGIPEIRFIDGMNLSTSVGYPLGGPKRNFITETPQTIYSERVLNFKDPIFMEEARKAEKVYLAGKQNHFIFKACLKDEPVKLEKDKVRVFQCAPMVCQILIRKYYLPLARILSMHPLVSECAIGINAFSPEWEEMHNHVTKFGDVIDESRTNRSRIFAGDYKAWDQKLPTHVVMAAFQILIDLAKASGQYTEDDITIMYGLAYDIAQPMVCYNGTLMQFLGSNPSGQNLTAYINSIANSLLIRMYYFSEYRHLPFRKFVAIMTYGDDVEGSVSALLKNFTIAGYSDWLFRNIGMTFTMPDKTSELTDFLNKDTSDFLKRKSRYHPEIECIIGVLDLESIKKSLYCVRGLKTNEVSILISCATSATYEYFFHGREIYEQHLAILKTAFALHNITVPCLDWEYEHHVEKWKRMYLKGYEGDGMVYHQMEDWLAPPPQLPTEHTDLSIHVGAAIDVAWVKRRPRQMKQQQQTPTINSFFNIDGFRAQYSDAAVAADATKLRSTLIIHSGIMEESTESTHPLLDFVTKPGDEVHEEMSNDDTFYLTATADASMSTFLARPLLIATYAWTINVPLDTTLDAWGTWLQNSRVINRIGNYKYINGTMCLKILVNGSPFHYGKVIFCVNPWPSYDTVLTESGSTYKLDNTQLTCLRHVSIDPSCGTAGCLAIPLINPHTLTPIDFVENVFNIPVKTINNLQSTSTTPSDLTISVFAWMEDVTLSSPIAKNSGLIIPQSGNEYGTRPVSMYSSMVAKIAGSFNRAPVIGPYARATEMLANGVGAVATLFGYSRPNTLAEEMPMQNKPLGNMANFNYGDSSTKLGLDAQNEVTIDPKVVGSTHGDEMDILSIASRRSLLSSFYVTSVQPYGTPLYRAAVRPTLGNADGAWLGFTTLVNTTPMGHVSVPFKYWTGSIRYKIEIVASKMHKGKLRIVHEPAGYLPPLSNSPWIVDENLIKSYVIDLDVERSYEFVVGWTHRLPYLEVPLLDQSNTYINMTTSGTLSTNPAYDNGAVGIHVLTPITGPSTPTGVYVNVYVSAGDDFQLSCPTQIPTEYTTGFLAPHSGLETSPAEGDVLSNDLTTPSRSPMQNHKIDSIFMGERVVSIRQILKRYNYVRTYVQRGAVNGSFIWKLQRPNFPAYKGPDLYGLNTTADGKFCNFGTNTYLNWFSPAYLCRRGALRHKYLFSTNQPGSYVFDKLIASRGLTPTTVDSLITYAAGTNINTLSYNETQYNPSQTGCVVAVGGLNPTLEFETPYYSNSRFEYGQDRNINTLGADSISLNTHLIYARYMTNTTFTGRSAFAERYVAAGEDFSLSIYKYPPAILVWTFAPPTATA